MLGYKFVFEIIAWPYFEYTGDEFISQGGKYLIFLPRQKENICKMTLLTNEANEKCDR